MPRALGTRLPFRQSPSHVRTWVDSALGAPVVEAVDQEGGMSPGCATRLRTADGRRAFLKAVGLELNPDTPGMYRHEAHVLSATGADPLWADLLDWYDDQGWVGLLLEDVPGGHPDLADDAVMDRLMADTDRLVSRLAGVAAPAGMPTLSDRIRPWRTGLEQAAEVPRELMPSWVAEARLELLDRADALFDALVRRVTARFAVPSRRRRAGDRLRRRLSGLCA